MHQSSTCYPQLHISLPFVARKLISVLRTHVARHDRHDRQLVLASLNICQTSSESFRCPLPFPPPCSLRSSLLYVFYTLSCSFALLIVCILFLFACLAAPISLSPPLNWPFAHVNESVSNMLLAAMLTLISNSSSSNLCVCLCEFY